MSNEAITALMGLIGAVIGAVVTGLFLKKKNDADAASVISEAAKGLVEPLRKQIADYAKRIDGLETEVYKLKCQYQDKFDAWLKGIRILIKQIYKLGAKPEWVPEELQGFDEHK
jgi:hypothetical protein